MRNIEFYLLDKIEKKVKEKNINLKEIDLPFACFPKELLDVFNDELKRKNYKVSKEKEDVLYNIKLCFDDNHNAYLLLTDITNYKIIVSKKNCNYEGIKYYPRSNENKILDFGFRKFMDNYYEYFKKNACGSDMVTNIYFSYLTKCSDLISNCYDKKLNDYKLTNKIKISFISAESEEESVTRSCGSSEGTRKRVNPEILVDDRMEILNSNSPKYVIEASDLKSDDDSISYVVYFYDIKNENYRLIAEPVSGLKYTKVMYIKDCKDCTLDEIAEVTQDLLGLSRKEITDAKDITRHSHTDINRFEDLINYLLKKSNDLPYINRLNIDEASRNSKSLIRK